MQNRIMRQKSFYTIIVLICVSIGFTPTSANQRKAIQNINNKAFSSPAQGINQDKMMDFLLGKAIFKKLWVSSPASTTASDGLGPLYNARSCLGCHPKNGRGQPFQQGKETASLILNLSIAPQTPEHQSLLRLGKLDHIPDPVYGSQLQSKAVQGLNREGIVHTTYRMITITLHDGEKVILRKPSYNITDWGYGKPHKPLQISPRLAPQMIGLGLLESIPSQDIMENSDPKDRNKDGISGKASKVWSHIQQKITLGRFGWKASTPSVLEQSSKALSRDIGISNPIFRAHEGDCTPIQKSCHQAPNGQTARDDNLEIGIKLNNKLAFYSANLAVPPKRDQQNPQIKQGKRLFKEIGCVQCHKPSFKTHASSKSNRHLSNKTIWPYSDLLLHDMGKGLADHRPVHNATGSEWRTAPLWGIGLSKIINGNAYFLHDGRARSIQEAIIWHGGEAKQARHRYSLLDKQDRERILAFVKSL